MKAQNSELGTEVIGPGGFDELLDAFQDAFSDYLIDVSMDGRKLRRMLRRRSVDLGHSVSLVEGRRILGFVLNGLRVDNGIKTGYDAGTGVRRDYRGRGLGRRLLEDTLEHLRGIGAKRYLLEVLTENSPAIALYESAGFAVDRQLRCFKTTSAKISDEVSATRARRLAMESFPWSALRSLRLFEPSWQNNMEFLASQGAVGGATVGGTEEPEKKGDPIAIVAEGERGIDGFLVCDPDGGQILDLGLAQPAGTEDQVFSHLLQETRRLWAESNSVAGRRAANAKSHAVKEDRGTEDSEAKDLTGEQWEVQFLNVDTGSVRALSLLDRFGFEPYVDQFEMSRSL